MSVISSDPPCKDYNARFTKVPVKALSVQVWMKYQCSQLWKADFFVLSLLNWLAHFYSRKTFEPKNTTTSSTLLDWIKVLRVSLSMWHYHLEVTLEVHLKLRLQSLWAIKKNFNCYFLMEPWNCLRFKLFKNVLRVFCKQNIYTAMESTCFFYMSSHQVRSL